MKEYGKKISRYLMKNKKGRFYCVAGVLYLLAILFVMNDAWLYQTPIVKVTKVVTIVEGKSKSTRGTEETKYKQSLYGKIINGEDKGKEVRIANEYTTTEMADQKYHKGDRVFYKGSSIIGVKRDTMLVCYAWLPCTSAPWDCRTAGRFDDHNSNDEYPDFCDRFLDGG